mmetsp:Transcript_25664/g.78961  ORF Transcript_25664/g.78961 Transcript_25664/m.78961 type:complete len:220 (-) Transcript_25664:338-997(-)
MYNRCFILCYSAEFARHFSSHMHTYCWRRECDDAPAGGSFARNERKASLLSPPPVVVGGISSSAATGAAAAVGSPSFVLSLGFLRMKTRGLNAATEDFFFCGGGGGGGIGFSLTTTSLSGGWLFPSSAGFALASDLAGPSATKSDLAILHGASVEMSARSWTARAASRAEDSLNSTKAAPFDAPVALSRIIRTSSTGPATRSKNAPSVASSMLGGNLDT